MVDIKAEENPPGLTILDEQPIHILSQIQPHGILLVLEEPRLKILQISHNIESILGISTETILYQYLEDLLDSFQMERIGIGLKQDNLDFINPTKIWIKIKGDDYIVFDGVFHRNSLGYLILELEPVTSQENIPFLSFYHLAKVSINQLESSSKLLDFCRIIVQEVQKITGFDRVMLYKFNPEGHGEVIAEEKRQDMEPYLGLHYPASDIPKPAR
ncbi:MAG: cyanobacterial phytochrome A, partial [Planktothrix sp.]